MNVHRMVFVPFIYSMVQRKPYSPFCCFNWFDKDTIKDYSLYCKLIRNSIIDSLKYSNGNQNQIGQIFISISQEMNEINQQMIDKAVLDGIPTTSIFISPLGSQILPQNSSN